MTFGSRSGALRHAFVCRGTAPAPTEDLMDHILVHMGSVYTEKQIRAVKKFENVYKRQHMERKTGRKAHLAHTCLYCRLCLPSAKALWSHRRSNPSHRD
jgi:hypothetical protein